MSLLPEAKYAGILILGKASIAMTQRQANRTASPPLHPQNQIQLPSKPNNQHQSEKIS